VRDAHQLAAQRQRQRGWAQLPGALAASSLHAGGRRGWREWCVCGGQGGASRARASGECLRTADAPTPVTPHYARHTDGTLGCAGRVTPAARLLPQPLAQHTSISCDTPTPRPHTRTQ
jgi:hypothetical protein